MTIRDLQAARDQLDKGDDVLIRRSPDGPVYRGTIVEMHARMAAVKLTKTGKVEVIPLTKLSKVVDTSESLAQPPPKPLVRAVADKVFANVTPIPVGEKLSAPPPTDDVAAWLEIGRTLASGIELEIEKLEAQARELLSDASHVITEASKLAESMKREAEVHLQAAKNLQRRFDALNKITGAL